MLMETKIVTREDLAQLLASIGKPGKKREEKLAAVKALNVQNSQGHDLSLTLESFQEF